MTSPLSNDLLQQEQAYFEQEVSNVKQWWKKDRFRLVTRPYTAEDGIRLF